MADFRASRGGADFLIESRFTGDQVSAVGSWTSIIRAESGEIGTSLRQLFGKGREALLGCLSSTWWPFDTSAECWGDAMVFWKGNQRSYTERSMF